MNINIIRVSNGWVVTSYAYDHGGIPYPSFSNTVNNKPAQEQFIFLTLEELINWIKTTAVMNQLAK